MKTNTLSKSYVSKIESLKEALSSVKQDIITAGKILVELLEENDNTFEILVSQRVAALQTLEALERVGRGKLDPLLLTDPSPIAQRAISQCIPMAQQRQLQTGTVEVVVESNGGIAIENKRKEEITFTESQRVIGDGKIRSTAEQTQIVMQQKSNRAKRELRYEISSDKIHFFHDSEFTYSELVQLCDKIKPKASDIAASLAKNQIVK
jgi:hypothetical protein